MDSRNFLMTLFSKEHKAPAQGGRLRGRVGVVTHKHGEGGQSLSPERLF